MTQFVTVDRVTLERLKHSVKQARIFGNDWRRELELIESTVDAALTNAEPAGWQKIETAPKDGTLILVREPRCSGLAVMYSNGWKYESGNISYLEATHWMPLTAAPKDTL